MTNRLSQAQSAYLRAHGHQPVDWHPWGKEAFALAKTLDKPILLSIGYHACHWCHVMAQESFSDPVTAQLINEGFVNIKVDREERPDIDQLYQTAHRILRRGHGGWPLTIFLSPQGIPFYSGTYFSREAQMEQAAFADILASVSTVWNDKRDALARQDQALLERLQAERARIQEDLVLDTRADQQAMQQLTVAFDALHGGFGGAPKFPHPTDLAYLLRQGQAGDESARHMALYSLRKMAEGGLFDQIGGGFFRYSTDTRWQIPHYEKMLCDNALLIELYARAYACTDDRLFAQVFDQTVNWLHREMRHEAGGFLASQPADDKQGHEGGFYTWDRETLRTTLIPMEWDVCSAHWGLIDPPNAGDGKWHLHVARGLDKLAGTLDRPLKLVEDFVATARDKLLSARSQRSMGESDNLVLTSWTALAVTALAHAGALCQQHDWIELARQTLDHLRATRWTRDGRLLSLPHQDGCLDDHAFLLEAVLAVHEVDPGADDIGFAHILADTLLGRFEDSQDGGFFMTPHDAPDLFFRLKPGIDTATPSGNGTAALVLIRLNKLAPQQRYLMSAARCVQAFAAAARQDPASHTRLLEAAAALR
ncbi:thioredoxin domain-containing protein [Aquabacterium sp.]|uniref:thioredoxin domain-containing protein n=1 Tax=Aquabacterium sp. TaxID=1872578 RepID=UPI0025C33FC8|nr:thioredoxin domain-containing protein [Aquabacterium sp.]